MGKGLGISIGLCFVLIASFVIGGQSISKLVYEGKGNLQMGVKTASGIIVGKPECDKKEALSDNTSCKIGNEVVTYKQIKNTVYGFSAIIQK